MLACSVNAPAVHAGTPRLLAGLMLMMGPVLSLPASCTPPQKPCVNHRNRCCGPAPAPAPPTPLTGWVSWAMAERSVAGMPFELSLAITDITYAAAGPSNTSVPSCTGPYPPKSQCIGADTWYPTWSSGGDLFSTFTDGIAAGVDGSYAHPLSCGQCSRSPRPPSTWHNNGSSTDTGMARIVGDTPGALSVYDVQTVTSSALPYQGRYPCASFTY
eukprot:COSAG02_NODE_21383_length_790_cov_1.192475_1_plen_214_part_10